MVFYSHRACQNQIYEITSFHLAQIEFTWTIFLSGKNELRIIKKNV